MKGASVLWKRGTTELHTVSQVYRAPETMLEINSQQTRPPPRPQSDLLSQPCHFPNGVHVPTLSLSPSPTYVRYHSHTILEDAASHPLVTKKASGVKGGGRINTGRGLPLFECTKKFPNTLPLNRPPPPPRHCFLQASNV